MKKSKKQTHTDTHKLRYTHTRMQKAQNRQIHRQTLTHTHNHPSVCNLPIRGVESGFPVWQEVTSHYESCGSVAGGVLRGLLIKHEVTHIHTPDTHTFTDTHRHIHTHSVTHSHRQTHRNTHLKHKE